MNETTPAWDDLRLFLAVAREGGLSPAAQQTGKSPATLSRRMLALEQALRKTLFVRHDRGYTLTPDGEALLADAAGVAAGLEALLQPATTEALPVIKVSAGSWTTLWLLNHVTRLSGDPPDVRLCFVASETVLDMPHRAVTIGLRNARPTEQNLAGKQVRDVQFAPFATESAPDRWIRVLSETPSAKWVMENAGDAIACEVTAPRNSLDLALCGVGIAILPTFVAAAYPTLAPRGPVVGALSHTQWIVTHQDDRHQSDVRRVLNRLYDLFAT